MIIELHLERICSFMTWVYIKGGRCLGNSAYLLSDEFLPHEFSGLKHVWNVVEWAETLVLVLDLFLSEDRERERERERIDELHL